LAVLASLFSSISSCANVGLIGLSNFLAGVPGILMALLRGDLGVMGTATDSRLVM
jgi:hypothetical protein